MNKKIQIFFSILIIAILISFLYFKLSNKNESNNNIVYENEDSEVESNIMSKNNLVSYNGKLKISGVDLVNQYDEKFQLKGISSHGIQWYGQLVTYENLKTLRDEWGSNAFRIAMYTEENGYISDNSIKEKVYEIIDYLTELDMYAIVDWHILNDGNPNQYKEEAIKFFDEISSNYKDNNNIIYEICNEPNGNVTWENDIKPYSKEIINVIRKNNKDAIIIVGTGSWDQDLIDPADDPLNYDNIMYACHFYAGTHTEWLRNRIDYARNKNICIIVSEWGVSDATGNGGVYLEEATKWINYMNDNNISWFNWSLSDKNESSALLKQGTTIINDDNLSESGKFVKQNMK
jgi:endoglucanase